MLSSDIQRLGRRLSEVLRGYTTGCFTNRDGSKNTFGSTYTTGFLGKITLITSIRYVSKDAKLSSLNCGYALLT